ncbi:hypothetical protein SLNWT_1687 [Streptomyces albus]|uniref:DUF4188 domain-containing protein n=1 Tax=Streptomyces albus (strain ATCC 21838 / DSM 41398 / FERM P-419 / JCM 4703 / NBRC 107858) TaxID=1081613 RepID=A0A0B5EII9_STRA4|nr:hypothetical protein SLNWT_1687 [Streptomyces albus]AOU76380.1 hypothetical protein SLNHY_1689 [Streptomyces albus]AYN32165.1 DUF4188 domain-containing protein [Streptomyces albus]
MFAKPVPGRAVAAAEGEVVVLLIGMRINHFWAVHHWLPVFLAMPRMLRELSRDKERGLLGHTLLSGSPRTYYVVQYWESREKLYAYAKAPDMFHRAAWARLNRKEKKARQHVGLWHESYLVPEGGYENIYFDMPPYGLAKAKGVLPVEARGRSAAARLAHRTPGRETASASETASVPEAAPAPEVSVAAEAAPAAESAHSAHAPEVGQGRVR